MPLKDHEKIDLAERAERLTAEIYTVLAGKFAHDKEARALFASLASEEGQHAMHIQMLRKRYFTSEIKSIQLDTTNLERFLAEGEALKEIFAADDELEFDVVLLRMAEYEDQLAGVHAHMMISASDSSVKKFFEQCASLDKGHAQLLKKTESLKLT